MPVKNPATAPPTSDIDKLPAGCDLADLAPPETEAPDRLQLPEETRPVRIYWTYAIVLIGLHLLALLALVPWLFSWTGVVLAIAGHFVFGMMGVTIGYHRLLTHRGFACPRWFEYFLSILGICNLQDSPARWVAIHRMHHRYSDHQPDPHSPFVNFLWAHMGWLMVHNRSHDFVVNYERYARDLLRQPFYLKLERNYLWLLIYLGHAAVFFLTGLLVGWWSNGRVMDGVQFGLSLLVWGVFLRTVIVLHGTWAVNSLTHVWGYQNYRTRDHSQNNWLVALLSHGEGWHNNHHAHQRASNHGHYWWELDMSHWVISTLERAGLVWDVVRYRPGRGHSTSERGGSYAP